MNFGRSVLGFYVIEIFGNPEDIFNTLSLHGIEWWNGRVTDHGVILRIAGYNEKNARLCLERRGNKVEVVSRHGFPIFLGKLLRRPGIILGSLMFITAMIFYGEFVFDIKVSGNERLSDKYIIDALENSGFRVGSFIPSVDFDELSNKVPIEYGDISWIFVNMMGNVAQVEVREYKKGEENKSEEPPSDMTDLVATECGQIYRFEVSQGLTKVSIGDVVSRGQILVSGMEKGLKADYFGRSSGRVFAKLELTLGVTQPMQITEERIVEKKLQKKSVKFLGIEINLFKNSGNIDASCDIIEESYKLTLPDRTELPIVVTKRYLVKKEKITCKLTTEQARELAEREFSRVYFEKLREAEILETERTEGIDGESYKIFCKVYCIKNIALEIPALRDEGGKETEEK